MKIGLYSVTYRGVSYVAKQWTFSNLVRLAKRQGWDGLELDAERPHAGPMDLNTDNRKRLRDLAGEVGVELCAVSPNCDLFEAHPRAARSHDLLHARVHQAGAQQHRARPSARSSQRGVASPCTTAWQPTTTRTAITNTGFGSACRRGFVVESMRELCKVAGDHGVVLAMQNHGPDIVNRYQDVLALIDEVGSPVFKACMDINIEPESDSPEHAREMAEASRAVQVHSHMNGELARAAPTARSSCTWPAAISTRSLAARRRNRRI